MVRGVRVADAVSSVITAVHWFSEPNIQREEGTERNDETAPLVARDGGVLPEQPSDTPDSEENSSDDVDFDDEKLLNGIGLPLFMLDRDGEVIAWNESIEQVTGSGSSDIQTATEVKEALYPNAQVKTLLAEQVRESPEQADETSGVTVGDDQLTVYETDQRASRDHGPDRHYECSARPLYQDGELAAVLQTVQDRTADVRRHETISALVEELIDTFEALAEGDLEARAEFDASTDVLDDELLAVVGEVNAMADQLESLTDRVDSQTETLAELSEESAEAAERIDAHVARQRDLLDAVGGEMEQFSGNMQEVAANADQIAAAADSARNAASAGHKAGERASDATDSVTETSDELVDTVQQLEESIDDIEEILDVIDDVAEQTNMLALNASIESARAGDAGEGFGIVADEIKQLASETREHTETIDDKITTIQSQADTATSAVQDSHSQVQQTSAEIDTALSSLTEIAEAVDETATGIKEVAEANEAQATTVQEVLDIVDDARDQADNVETTSDEIVALVENQRQGIEELQNRVASLSRTD